MKRPDDVTGLVQPWRKYADELEARELGLIATVRELEAQNKRLRKALIEIAEQGCESDFDDDQEICSTLSGYTRDNWCNPCLANVAALGEGDE